MLGNGLVTKATPQWLSAQKARANPTLAPWPGPDYPHTPLTWAGVHMPGRGNGQGQSVNSDHKHT